MSSPLSTFLGKYAVPKDTPGVTHCGSGSWVIPPAEEPMLHELIAQTPEGSIIPYLVETSLASDCSPLVLDLDFTTPEEPDDADKRLWELSGLREGWTKMLAQTCFRVYNSLLDEVPPYITFFVLERPQGYLSKQSGKFKDGIHIHAPSLYCDLVIHRHARTLVLAELPPPMRSILEPVWDTSINKSNRAGKLAMYGTGKMGEPQCYPYQLVEELGVSATRVTNQNNMPRSRSDVINVTSIRIEQRELRRREGIVFSLSPTEPIVGGSTDGVVELPPAEPASPEQWLDVIDLVGMLSVERATISGLLKEHKDADKRGCAQVINVVYHLSGGSEEGRQLALRFTESATTWWDTPAKATRSLAWFSGIWRNSTKYELKGVKKNHEDLDYWVRVQDNPVAYKAWKAAGKQRVPVFTPMRSLSFSPATSDEEARLIAEIVPGLLELPPTVAPEGWQLVPDKDDKLPFNHRYLFGDATDPHAGLCDFSKLVPCAKTASASVGGGGSGGGDPFSAPKATLAIFSHLGTGKTKLFKQVASQRLSPSKFAFPKILYICARRTFTQSQMGEMTEEVDKKAHPERDALLQSSPYKELLEKRHASRCQLRNDKDKLANEESHASWCQLQKDKDKLANGELQGDDANYEQLKANIAAGEEVVKGYDKEIEALYAACAPGVMVKVKKSLGFVSYLDVNGQLSSSREKRLFCQTESLIKFMDTEKGKPRKMPGQQNLHYNVVILDELESIVASLRPSTTMRGKLLDNLAVFTELVRNADVVVAGDAFITQRSLDVLRELRHDLTPLRIIINHSNPYGEGFQERTMKRCYSIVEEPKDKSKLSKSKREEWVPHESVEGSITLFHSRLIADLKAGLKVVAVWGSKRAGMAFEQRLKQEFISSEQRAIHDIVRKRWLRWVIDNKRGLHTSYQPQFEKLVEKFNAHSDYRLKPFRYQFFHSGNKATNSNLTNLNNKWADLNYLAYSPTITVGINYNPLGADGAPINCFQRLYLYACRFGATPRDLFQASLRVRVIQPPPGTPHMVYVIDHRLQPPACVGLENCQIRTKELKSLTGSAHELAKRLTHRESNQGLIHLFSGAELRNAPSWFDLLLARNINEGNVSSAFPQEVIAHYLKLCGYTQSDSLPEFVGETVLIPKMEQFPPCADVPCVSKHTKELLKDINISVNESLTPTQQLAINKYYFHERLGLPTCDVGRVCEGQMCGECLELKSLENNKPKRERAQVICEHLPPWKPDLALPAGYTLPAWCAEPGLLDLLWRGTVKCAEPCPLAPQGGGAAGGGGGDPAHVCETSTTQDGFCSNAKQFKQIALSKMATHADTLSACLSMDYHDGGATLDYDVNNFAAKAQVMSLIVSELGLPHAGKAHKWSQEEFNALIPKLTAERQWPDLAADSALQNKSLLDRAFFVFGLSDRSGKGDPDKNASGKTFKISLPHLVSSKLSRLFSCWCLSSFKLDINHRVVKKPGKNEGKLLTPAKKRPEGTPDFNTWQASGSPQRTDAENAVGKVWKDQLKWLTAKWEADYPLETPLEGIELVPWHGRTSSDDPTTGLLWVLVPPYQVSTTTSGLTPMFADDIE